MSLSLTSFFFAASIERQKCEEVLSGGWESLISFENKIIYRSF